MPYSGILGCNFEELSVYEKSALSNCKVLCKNKNPQDLAPKMPYLGIKLLS